MNINDLKFIIGLLAWKGKSFSLTKKNLSWVVRIYICFCSNASLFYKKSEVPAQDQAYHATCRSVSAWFEKSVMLHLVFDPTFYNCSHGFLVEVRSPFWSQAGLGRVYIYGSRLISLTALLFNICVFFHPVIFRSQAFWKKAHKKTPLTKSVPSPASCGLSLLLGTSPSDQNSVPSLLQSFFSSELRPWLSVSWWLGIFLSL